MLKLVQDLWKFQQLLLPKSKSSVCKLKFIKEINKVLQVYFDVKVLYSINKVKKFNK